MKHLRVKVYAVVLGAMLGCLPLFAQLTSGNITGDVYDPAGATVPGATVVVHNVATGVENTTTTTSAGVYLFENLPVGTYNVTVNAPGFAKAEVTNVTVELNQTVTSNVQLGIAQATTTVEVTTAAVAIDTTTAQIQNTFNTKTIQDLPITATGSGVLNLSLLAPGVATSGVVGAGSGPSVGGQRPRNNNFTVEGIENNSGSVTGPLVSIPNDAVSEFTMLQNQFSPEFGHSSGGQFNQVVKSGTNQFHGMLYEYFQNRNLNAGDNLAAVSGTPLHPRYDNNRFGGNVGGPIKRNKLFFFFDYEYNPVGAAGTPGLIYAPTAAGYSTLAAIPGINQTNFNILKKYLAPAPSACVSGVGTCPSVLIASPANGPAYNNGFPSNATAIQVGSSPVTTPSYSNNEAGVASIDYNISEKDSLRGRFILNRTGSIDTAAQLPVFFSTVPTNNYLIAFSEYHNFSPTVINELRLGYNRNNSITPVGNFTFPGLDQFPNLVFNDLGVQLGPDPNAPQGGTQNLYEVTDNVTWSKGAHDIRIGFDGTRDISPQHFTQRSRGDYEYTYLNDYLFDFTPDYLAQRSAGNPTYWGNRYLFGWYINDQWKVLPNLTVNLGLRYEFQTVPASENEQSLNAISSVPGLITFSSPKPEYKDYMPRVGFAYSPGTTGKTSVRGGFGISYDVLFDNLGLLTLPPQLETTQDVTGLNFNQGSFLASGGLPPTGGSTSFTASEARAKTGGYVPNMTRPEAYSWNLGVQHEFGSNYVFESQYIGTRGLYLDVQDQLNRQPVVNASNALPVYFTAPSLATLNASTNTLGALNASLNAGGNIVPAYLANGFTGIVTSYQPYGNSIYNGWANELRRRFNNGLQFILSYTWSHDIDNSTADVFSTYATPRRPQNSQDLAADRSSSALDHRNRLSYEVMYDFMPFKNRNWFMKNVIGNWEVAPIYTYQTGTFYTPQSGVDSNLNGDSAPDRVIINPGGNVALGSGVTPLCSGPTAPACPAKGAAAVTVGYLVDNPAAMFVQAPKGTIATGGRNLLKLNPIDDIDVTAMKRINFTERVAMQFEARAFNVLNHPQYTGGLLNDVAPIGATGTDQRLTMEPQNPLFQQITQAYSSNPRGMVLTLKLTF